MQPAKMYGLDRLEQGLLVFLLLFVQAGNYQFMDRADNTLVAIHMSPTKAAQVTRLLKLTYGPVFIDGFVLDVDSSLFELCHNNTSFHYLVGMNPP